MRGILGFILLTIVIPSSASAYVGPGAGLGAVAAALALVGAIFMGFFAFLYYPIKRLLKKKKKAPDTTQDQDQ